MNSNLCDRCQRRPVSRVLKGFNGVRVVYREKCCELCLEDGARRAQELGAVDVFGTPVGQSAAAELAA